MATAAAGRSCSADSQAGTPAVDIHPPRSAECPKPGDMRLMSRCADASSSWRGYRAIRYGCLREDDKLLAIHATEVVALAVEFPEDCAFSSGLRATVRDVAAAWRFRGGANFRPR